MASRVQQALRFFTDLGLTPAQAAGFVGNLQQESGQGLDPTAIGAAGELGIAQHLGPRRVALTRFAEERGTDPSDFATQLDFIGNEFRTTEKAAFDKLRTARTPAEAAEAALAFFRPGDPQTSNRVRNAVALAGDDDPIAGDRRFGNPVPPTGVTNMANGPRGILDSIEPNAGGGGILSDRPFWEGNFLLNLGAGILAANQPGTSLGSAIGQGLLGATERRQAQGQNELIRQRLLDAGRKREALTELRGLLADDPNASVNDPNIRALLFEIDPGAAIDALTPPKPTGLEARFGSTEKALGRPLSEEEILNISGASGEGGGLSVPLSPTDLTRMRLPNGAPLPLGTTLQQAMAMGARVLSANDQKRLAQADQALAVLTEVEELATGPEGIFTDVEPGFLAQAGAAMEFALDSMTRGDPRVSRFNDLRGATVGPFVRMLGETGALAEGDVSRALGLLPSTGSLNPFNPSFADSEDQAREKLALLRRLIEKGVRNLRSGKTAVADTLDTGAGADFRFDPTTGELVPLR